MNPRRDGKEHFKAFTPRSGKIVESPVQNSVKNDEDNNESEEHKAGNSGNSNETAEKSAGTTGKVEKLLKNLTRGKEKLS